MMPEINVYLPGELAAAVKDAGVPVSAVCRRALEQAVRQVTAIRETVLDDLDDNEPARALAHFTARTRDVLKLAVEQARAAGTPSVGTEHLLGAVLAVGDCSGSCGDPHVSAGGFGEDVEGAAAVFGRGG